MAFESTSRNIYLTHGGVLWADCRYGDNEWRHTPLELSSYIGNLNGEFSFLDTHYLQSATDIQLHGATLTANLRRRDGTYTLAALNLNLCVANINGFLEFQKPGESLLRSGCCLKLAGPMLRGLCLGSDGKFHSSEINLDNHYENSNGDFTTGRNFSRSSRNVTLEVSSHSVLLKAELRGKNRHSKDFWNATTADLTNNILVRDGCFIFEKHDGIFDREGPLAKFFERVPLVGFVVAGLHALAGNEEQAKRAVALCTNSSIVCGAIIIGTFLGGPLGAAIGAGLVTPLGILAETTIAGTIKDPHTQAQFEEATIGRYIYDTIRNTVAVGVAGYVARHLGALAKDMTTQVLSETASQFGAGIVTRLSSSTVCELIKKIADALVRDGLPAEWKVVKAGTKER